MTVKVLVTATAGGGYDANREYWYVYSNLSNDAAVTFIGVDLGIGLAVALLVAAANHFALHPLIRSVTPTFDPTLSILGPIELVLLQVVGVAAEDTLYRGYALTRLSERFSRPTALVLSALSYAAISAGQGWAMVVWAILFGLLLGALFRWRGSLWPVVVAHYVLALVPRLVAAVQS